MLYSAEEFEQLVEERQDEGITLFDVGQTFDDPRDKIPAEAWSVVVWAPEDVDWEELAQAVADEENGDFVWRIEPRATNVHVMGKILDEYDAAGVWDNWACENADEWKVFDFR